MSKETNGNNWYKGIVDIEMRLERIKRDGSKQDQQQRSKKRREGKLEQHVIQHVLFAENT